MVLLLRRRTTAAAAGGRMNLGSAGTLAKLALTHLLECASNGRSGVRVT